MSMLLWVTEVGAIGSDLFLQQNLGTSPLVLPPSFTSFPSVQNRIFSCSPICDARLVAKTNAS